MTQAFALPSETSTQDSGRKFLFGKCWLGILPINELNRAEGLEPKTQNLQAEPFLEDQLLNLLESSALTLRVEKFSLD